MIIQYLRKNDGKTEITGRRLMIHDELEEEVRIHRGTPIGVVVAMGQGINSFSIGWAKCKNGDTFTKSRGLQIAKARAMMGKILIMRDGTIQNPAEPDLNILKSKKLFTTMMRVAARGVAYFFKGK